ncbi:MAG TPA: 2-amino-4-hydroxy-6-hydroxymethyldihydropteridine diphosphokinase [Gammaproteobacteria bacterium]|nr:2-amino-4-hydroxy-6-hydroxymethyldihydropteridine diphosphokinase [Gammaproteobacteria bacterium]HDH15176.1 2-amino-4-hydroxy-6-hydroxymethyldihydropteridine diphosphokinase [Gammaproteobacteria bacterium]HDZ78104.1 2-amino-4-hydroxy-6-hydroxymethyldihydropteridine diphosphokinase [Gammaproteobacteria bacterium]
MAILAMTKNEIDAVEGFSLKKLSPLYRTKPIDVTDSQDDYINAVFEIETILDAEVVLQELTNIENRHGRSRCEVKNIARTLDLDLLLFGNKKMKSKTLILPHPRIYQRAFVLFPLFDLSPELEIPGQGNVQTLLDNVRDQEVEQL